MPTTPDLKGGIENYTWGCGTNSHRSEAKVSVGLITGLLSELNQM